MAMILEGALTADIAISGNEITSTSGAGAIGTGTPTAPRTWRSTKDGVITTQIKFDVTALGAVGTIADDVIGLTTGGAAYIGRYVVADCGVVFKTALSCVESPTEDAATFTADINITSNASAALAYDGAAGAVQPITGGGMLIGTTVENFLNTMAANDYLYITEEDTTASTGTFASGMYIFTMWGHAALA